MEEEEQAIFEEPKEKVPIKAVRKHSNFMSNLRMEDNMIPKKSISKVEKKEPEFVIKE